MAIVLDGTAGITTPDLTDTSLTSGRVVYAGTSGNLTGDSNLTYDGNTLILTGVQQITNSGGSTLVLNRAGNPSSLQFNFGGTETGQIQAVSGGGLVFYRGSTPTETMRFDAAGALLVGSSTNDFVTYGAISQFRKDPNGPTLLTVTNQFNGSSASAGTLFSAYGNSWVNAIGSSTNNSNALTWAVDATASPPSEKMRLTTGGDLLVGVTTGTSSGWVQLTTSNTKYSIVSRSSVSGTGAFLACANSAGTIVGTITFDNTTTSYNTSSDYRLKNTIAPMTGALAKVALLKPVTYKWNADGSDGEGFIAHELAEVVPDCVHGIKDALDANGNPKYQGIDTSFLVATLTAAIQEQQALITTLTERITALEGA